jgi:hypothetical protein
METKRVKTMERVTVPLPEDLTTLTVEELLAHPRRSGDVKRAMQVLKIEPSPLPLWLRAVHAGNLAVFLRAIGLATEAISGIMDNESDYENAFKTVTFSAELKHNDKNWWEWPHDEDDEDLVADVALYQGRLYGVAEEDGEEDDE